MFISWIVSTISAALLIALLRACVWFQRWDPIDFLKEVPDPGQYGTHRSANSLLPLDPAGGSYPQELSGMENESHASLLVKG